jgi:hypothetical protein
MLAILVKAKVLTEEAAIQLSEALKSEIHRSEFVDAKQTIENVTGRIEKFISEPWLADIARLTKRVEELEAKAVKSVESVAKPSTKK